VLEVFKQWPCVEKDQLQSVKKCYIDSYGVKRHSSFKGSSSSDNKDSNGGLLFNPPGASNGGGH
jgi:hypothetical protein